LRTHHARIDGETPGVSGIFYSQDTLLAYANYDRMNYSVGKGVILCQVTQSGIQLSTKRRRRIRSAVEYLRV
jgi:hypothetical protein